MNDLSVCICSGSMFVSSCKCWTLVSSVQPVTMHSAVFCMVCSLVMFVVDAIGDDIVETYSSIGVCPTWSKRALI